MSASRKPGARRRGFFQHAGFLGAAYNPLSAGGAGLSERYAHNRPQLALLPELTVRRVEDRRELQRRIQAGARMLEANGTVQEMDRQYQRAFELVTSPRVQAAFDVQREPLPLQDRYGRNAWGQAALLARRLVEAGVTFVTINHFEAEVDWWDDHYTIEANLKRRLPIYDQAVGALIEDLHDRGLGDDVLVAAFGEFGAVRRSTSRPVGATGRGPGTPCSVAAASREAAWSAPPRATAENRGTVASARGTCWPRFIMPWGSIRRRLSRTGRTARSASSIEGIPSASCIDRG